MTIGENRLSFFLGLGLTVVFLVTAIVGPLVYPIDPNAQSLLNALQPPGGQYPLGSDQFGRDVLARVLHGARYSTGIACSVVALSLATGIVLAGCALWTRGMVASGLTLVADSIYAMPGLLVILVVAGVTGESAITLVFLLWFVKWPEYYRLAYAAGRRIASSDHVLASYLAGARPLVIFRLQVLPVMLPYLLGIGALSVGQTVLSIATLGFLGIGIAPPQAEWGMMINELRVHWQTSPVQLAAPTLAIIWVVLGLLILSQSLSGRRNRVDEAFS
jgi:peptide/nickel transport system permease protein